MTTQSNHSDTSKPEEIKSIPSTSELLEAHAKWWKERAEQADSDFGFYGRDLRNQEDLLKTVAGMEQDITFLLRYVRSLTEHIDLVAPDPEATTDTKNPPKGEKEL